ncbi:DUF2868 domain-containing protein [Ectopseudomonas alcaliphila]|uniref:DUF2868 domain-containing protein n=1 Tax=Ectopseudomonas alcaliphila TaxID=101564 RepID=A0A1G7I1N1_9GAMM|nr:DUF2868 domain-containing protein [Pseudomonas alcaliphila]MDX5993595.1 DUF2868 domain-containing protein [Pseudomonas alcaliphila]SDF06518.1 Protein of unknown function [Pseudomonas alcaliphila]
MTDASSPTPFQRLWLSETIRLREDHAGPLEDAEANRLARAEHGDLAERIQHRALFLARSDGQWQALLHWLQGARLAGLLLALLALLSGFGLALAALGDGRQPVNVFWALGSLLGLNLLMLLGWLLGLLLTRDHPGALGRLWLWLSEKLARDASAAQLAPALLLMLQRQRLTRWGLGLMVNGLWSLAMLAALTTLLLLLATRRYGFVWETTILSGDTFIALTQAVGALPALLGFSLPDIDVIRASGDAAIASEAARQSWAGWLVGVVLIYGLLPRLLLTLLCLWRWQSGKGALRLDLELPGYGLLRQRLQPDSERLGVCDLAPAALHQPQGGASTQTGSGALLLGLELDDRRPWPPAPLPKGVADVGVIDSREQRRQLLEQLTRFPPERLAIACDPRRSPDRGTLALLGELARSASATRIWLLPPAPGESLDSARLADWHQAIGTLGLIHGDTAPLSWLESGHD